MFPLLLLPSCAWHISNTIAWNFAFPPDAFKPRLLTLFAAKLAGETVNQLTPLANLGGEPVKAYLLTHRTPGPRGMASVVVDKTAQIAVGLSFTVLGLGLLFYYHDVSELILLGIPGLVRRVCSLSAWRPSGSSTSFKSACSRPCSNCSARPVCAPT